MLWGKQGLERGAVREWGELVSGEDRGLGSWLVRVCACVTGKRGVYRALLWERAWIEEPCGNGGVGERRG